MRCYPSVQEPPMMSHLTQNQSQTPHNYLEQTPYNLAPTTLFVFTHLLPALFSLCSNHTGPLVVPQILQARLASRSFPLFSPLCLSAYLTPSEVPSSVRPSLTTYLQGQSPLLPCAFSVLLPALSFSVILITI